MSTLKISYNSSEIASVDVTAPLEVIYNNSTIATLNDGDIKTLCCNGKVMESDVVIGSKTLNCSGKLMQGDILIELVGSAASGSETWYFNDNLVYSSDISLNFNFTAKDSSYIGIIIETKKFSGTIMNFMLSENNKVGVYIYGVARWTDPAARTVILDEPATGDVLAFLEANATKLS